MNQSSPYYAYGHSLHILQLDVDDDKSWIELTLKLQGLQDHIYLNQKR